MSLLTSARVLFMFLRLGIVIIGSWDFAVYDSVRSIIEFRRPRIDEVRHLYDFASASWKSKGTCVFVLLRATRNTRNYDAGQ